MNPLNILPYTLLLPMHRRTSKFCFISCVPTKIEAIFFPMCLSATFYCIFNVYIGWSNNRTGRPKVLKVSWKPFAKTLSHFQENYLGSYVVSDAFPGCEAIQILVSFRLVFSKRKIQNVVVKLEGCCLAHRQAESVHSVNILLIHKW